MPTNPSRWLAVLSCALLAGLEIPAPAQSRMEMFEARGGHEAPESAADTVHIALHGTPADSLTLRWSARFDAGYRTPPVHPYFRDEYRVIQDLRRLLMFVDPFALPELASLPEMVAIARAMPEAKQKQIIGMALVGSAANQVSEMVSKYLRRSGARFLQWQLERVMVRFALPGLEARAYNGMNAQGFSLLAPVRGLSYSYHAAGKYRHGGVNFWPLPRAGFHYGWLNGAPIYGPRLASGLGQLSLNFESGNQIVLLGYEFRRQMKMNVRVIYVNHLTLPVANFWRSEVMMRW